MAYSKAKLESKDDKASPCFKSFQIGKMIRRWLPTRNLLEASFRHVIIIILSCFMRMPNSMRILYKTSFLTQSQTFLKSIKSWCTASLYSHSFWNIWRMPSIRSLYVTKTNKMHTLFSLIYFNKTILYMFRTKKFIVSRLFLYTQHTVIPMLKLYWNYVNSLYIQCH